MENPTHIKWNAEVWEITKILDYGIGGNIESLQVATFLRSRGWESKWADRLLDHVGSFSNEGKSYQYAQFSLCVGLEKIAGL